MGRPPIGKHAMSSTERVHRFRAKQRATKPETKHETKPSATDGAKVAALHARIRELEAELASERKRRGEGQLTRSRRDTGGLGADFSDEVGRLRAEIGTLKFDIAKLKAALAEEPDAAKLRQKVVDQQTELRNVRAAHKQTAKERDKYQSRVQ